MKRLIGFFTATTIVLFSGLGAAPVALADEEEPDSEIWSVTRGGQLYDHWGKVLLKEMPKETHPSYPAEGKQKGSGTWRCKECHGWDYKGTDGGYGKGSHYTGIGGIRDYVGRPPAEIAAIIRDDTHRYTPEMLPDGAIEKLALFVSRGQIDMPKYIDYRTKEARGDPKRGARFYQTICAICHGFDGKTMNFKTPENPEYIGTVANENPQETLHKTQNGQPGVPMVALGVLDIQDLVDIVAYAQTLPTK